MTITQTIQDAQDAAIVKLAGDNLAAYERRAGLQPGNDSGSWDMIQAAKLAMDVSALLEIIDRLTRPAGQHGA
jgi:hypothetical protein